MNANDSIILDATGYTHTYDTSADAFGDCTPNQHAAMCRFIEARAPVLFPGITVVAGLQTKTTGEDENTCEEITRILNDECMKKLARFQ